MVLEDCPVEFRQRTYRSCARRCVGPRTVVGKARRYRGRLIAVRLQRILQGIEVRQGLNSAFLAVPGSLVRVRRA